MSGIESRFRPQTARLNRAFSADSFCATVVLGRCPNPYTQVRGHGCPKSPATVRHRRAATRPERWPGKSFHRGEPATTASTSPTVYRARPSMVGSGLKGRDMPAQANGLGKEPSPPASPERARPPAARDPDPSARDGLGENLVSPFQGSRIHLFFRPKGPSSLSQAHRPG